MSEETQNSMQLVAASDAPLQVTLDEFGVGLSQRDVRHELVNAFIYMDRRSGKHKDTEAAYQARYVAFLDQPA